MLRALTESGLSARDVRRIVITHGDGDHWRGVAMLAAASGAEVVAHELEADYLERRVFPPFPPPKWLLTRVMTRVTAAEPRPRTVTFNC